MGRGCSHRARAHRRRAAPGPAAERSDRGGRAGLLRVHDWEETRHATWLELIFDLVFVVAVARLGVLLHDDHSAGGVLTFAGLLVPVWWAWISFSYYADLFDDDGPLNRLAQLGAMLGAAVVAVTITGGVAEDSGRFAVTFAGLFGLLAVLYAAAHRFEPRARELCRWYVAGSATGAAFWGLSLARCRTCPSGSACSPSWSWARRCSRWSTASTRPWAAPRRPRPSPAS